MREAWALPEVFNNVCIFCVCVCVRDLDIQKSQVIINSNTFLTALNKQKLTLYCK